jgi:hypothetical protein
MSGYETWGTASGTSCGIATWYYTDSLTSSTYALTDFYTYYGIDSNGVQVWPTPPPETEEQNRARLNREEEWKKQQEQLRKEQELAVIQAEQLLKENIGLEAFGKLYKVGYIEVDSQKYKGRKYRIPKVHMARIEVLDDSGKVIDRLCVHPAIECPAGDHILTRKVLLELDEEYILAKANHSLVTV